jgi:hypothetical protein
MKDLLNYADNYMKQCNWKDMALIKSCLFALGLLVGISLPKDKKKPFLSIASIMYVITYIPIMIKFVKFIISSKEIS